MTLEGMPALESSSCILHLRQERGVCVRVCLHTWCLCTYACVVRMCIRMCMCANVCSRGQYTLSVVRVCVWMVEKLVQIVCENVHVCTLVCESTYNTN